MKYLIVIEKSSKGFTAYSPDLPGCVAAGSSRAQVEREMKGAISLHLEGLRTEGGEIPEPHTYSTYVEVPV